MKERIIYLRKVLMIHSYLYYHVGESIISDYQWDKWAYELVSLQETDTRFVGFYDREFYDFDGSTGMHLPKDEWVVNKAMQLLKTHKEIK